MPATNKQKIEFFSKSREYVSPVGVTFPLKCNINKLTNVAGCFNHFSMPPAYFDGYQVQVQAQAQAQVQVHNSAFVRCIFTRISALKYHCKIMKKKRKKQI